MLSPLDVENGFGFGQKKCPVLAELIKLEKLLDIFRTIYPVCSEYTFFRPHITPSRLDRVYITPELLKEVNSVQHLASLSDHCRVFVDINLNNPIATNFLEDRRETY